MTELRLNAYRIMWLFVFFDLPTNTKAERRHAAQFSKALEKDGFSMMQFSVYVRHCASKENMQVHINRVRRSMPPSGYTSILAVTDKQYGDILNFWGKANGQNRIYPSSWSFSEIFCYICSLKYEKDIKSTSPTNGKQISGIIKRLQNTQNQPITVPTLWFDVEIQ